MTDTRPPHEPPDDTERLLRDAGGPRPLPPALRDRLAASLLEEPGRTPAGGGRALPTALRARLADALPGAEERGGAPERDDAGPEDTDGGPDRGADGVSGRRRRRWMAPVSAAAAVVLGAALAGVALNSGGGGSRAPVTASGASAPSQPGPHRASAANGAAGASSSASAGTGSAAGAPSGAGGSGPPGASAPQGAPVLGAVVTPPTVSGLAPATGPAGGGTWVVVTGNGLAGTTAVRFGATEARTFTVLSDTQLRVLSPPHVPGPVDVQVVTRAGATAANAHDRYTYTP